MFPRQPPVSWAQPALRSSTVWGAALRLPRGLPVQALAGHGDGRPRGRWCCCRAKARREAARPVPLPVACSECGNALEGRRRVTCGSTSVEL
jgi:hypothetical protein